MSVCLSVRSNVSKTTQPNFAKLFVHVAYGTGSTLLWELCDAFCSSGFVDNDHNVTFSHNCSMARQLSIPSGDRTRQT